MPHRKAHRVCPGRSTGKPGQGRSNLQHPAELAAPATGLRSHRGPVAAPGQEAAGSPQPHLPPAARGRDGRDRAAQSRSPLGKPRFAPSAPAASDPAALGMKRSSSTHTQTHAPRACQVLPKPSPGPYRGGGCTSTVPQLRFMKQSRAGHPQGKGHPHWKCSFSIFTYTHTHIHTYIKQNDAICAFKHGHNLCFQVNNT